jgi:AcrR family transcriptional regulator
MTRLSDRRERRHAADGLPCRGRPLDGDLDAAILDAAVALLGETGYERMTMDGVAARAKVSKATIYRRWDSKASLVVEAMRSCQFAEVEFPVTGDLRADLLGGLELFREIGTGSDAAIFHGVLMAMRQDPELARLVRERMMQPKQARSRAWLGHYVESGQLPPDTDVDVFHEVGIAMLASRIVITGEPVDDAFLARVVDDVLIPLLHIPKPNRDDAARIVTPPGQPRRPAPVRTTA